MGEIQPRYIIDFNDIPSKRQHMPELKVEERITNFEEVELGFSIEKAQQEARRCLSCRRCLGCGLCLAVCKPKAIVFEQEDEFVELSIDEIVIAPEMVSSSPMVNEYINVINAFQFESMLSLNGPTGGVIMRPFDGDIPQKIAFIINAKSDGDNNYLISYAVCEAVLALQKTEKLAVSIFVSDKESIIKTYEKEIKEGLTVIEGEIKEVKEKEDTKNLSVIFIENDQSREEEFDMIVRVQLPKTSSYLKALSMKLGLNMNDKILLDTPSPTLTDTSVPNIFYTGLVL
ncbi:MAG: hypothetical protein FP814_06030 [Desulfobacterium sp.]|nr:hypothetical protein [Desulfobacterium sp.]MBU3947559.1 hypothetical protein [Pseudomonadota bacterium]